MKNHYLRFLFLLLALGLGPIPASAQVQFSHSVFVGGPYVWRGEKLSSAPVLQPTLELHTAGFSLAFFGNLDARSGAVDDKPHFNEADLTLAYAHTLAGVTLSAGYTLYTFPAPGAGGLSLSPTQELFLGVEAPLPLAPSLLLAYDFDGEAAQGDLRGFYAELGLSGGQPVAGLPVTLSAALGYDGGYVLAEGEAGLSHVGLTLGTELRLGAAAVSPLLGWQLSLADAYAAAYGRTFFYGGFALNL